MAAISKAKYLLDAIKTRKMSAVEPFLRGDKTSVTALLTLELDVIPLLETVFTGHVLIFKLLQCEITTMTPAHFAALLGQTDMMMGFIDFVKPNAVLKSGTTFLHLASFGGSLATGKMLLDVFKVKADTQDIYGWTALHYASTEGHLGVVKLLVDHRVDISVRDKDGTCAALRAKWHGHEDVVTYFCEIGEEDTLLNIEEGDDPLYAKVGPKSNYKSNGADTPQPAFNLVVSPQRSHCNGLERTNSSFGGTEKGISQKKSANKFNTLPAKFKQKDHDSIRRIIRKQLDAAFSDYEQPVGPGISQHLSDQTELAMSGVGVNTMTKLMREEIQKYKDDILVPKPSATISDLSTHYEDEEDPYMTLGSAPSIPPNHNDSKRGSYIASAPTPPPLPPRNPEMAPLKDGGDYVSVHPKATVSNNPNLRDLRIQPTSAALNAAIEKLGRILGRDWKSLARSLPMDSHPRRLEERIKNIEKQYLSDVEKQAELSLIEWRINAGNDADVDALIIGLRKCGFHDRIAEVERVTQEFTA